MFARGTVFLKPDFHYLNSPGETGKKILILLNSPTTSKDNLILVKTTSRQHDKTQVPGCHQTRHKVFYIPKKTQFLNAETWVQLDDHFPFMQETAQRTMHVLGCLDSKTTQGIVDCFIEHNREDLSPVIMNLLVPKISQFSAMLAAKFNRK